MTNQNLTVVESENTLKVKTGFQVSRSQRKLEKLLQSARAKGRDKRRQVVQFLNLNRARDRRLPLSFEAAYTEASRSQNNVLYIDTSEDINVIKHIISKADNSGVVLKPLTLYPIENTKVSVVSIPRRIDDQGVDHEDLNVLIAGLKDRFPMIVIDGNSPIQWPENIEFSRVSDGTVLVLQAEVTRVPVVRQVSELLAKFDIDVIGSVLNNRKLYIPKIVYALLFRS